MPDLGINHPCLAGTSRAALGRLLFCFHDHLLIHFTMLKQRRRRGASNRKGSFNPDDRKNVRHTKIGVWDLYEEINPELARIPGSSRLETYMELLQGLPYVWRMLKDIGGIKDCWTLLGIYLLLEVAISLIPAVILW